MPKSNPKVRRVKENKKPYLIYIEWEDAIANAAWKSPKETVEWGKGSNMTICEVGWVIAENSKFIQLAGRWCKEDEYNYDTYGAHQKIPKTWIRKRFTFPALPNPPKKTE